MFWWGKNKPKKNESNECRNKKIEIVKEHFAEEIQSILNLLVSRSNYGRDRFLQCLDEFIAYTYNIPASADNHDKEEFGLIKHTLEVVFRSLILQQKKLNAVFNSQGNIDTMKTIMNKERILFATALKSLFHDMGKLFDVVVLYKENKQIHIFNPLEEKLVDFYIRHKVFEDNNFNNVQIKWKKNNKNLHEKRASIFFYEIINQNDREYLGPANFLRIVDEFVPFNSQDAVRLADYYAIKSENSDENDKNIDLIDKFLRTFYDMYKGGKITYNKENALSYIIASHTLLHADAGLSAVLGEMKRKYGKGIVGKANAIITILKEYNIIEVVNNQSILTATIGFGDYIYDIPVIIIDNGFIWKNAYPLSENMRVSIEDAGIYFPFNQKPQWLTEKDIYNKRKKEEENTKKSDNRQTDNEQENKKEEQKEENKQKTDNRQTDHQQEDKKQEENKESETEQETTQQTEQQTDNEQKKEPDSKIESSNVDNETKKHEKAKYEIFFEIFNKQFDSLSQDELFYNEKYIFLTVKGFKQIIFTNDEWRRLKRGNSDDYRMLIKTIEQSLSTSEKVVKFTDSIYSEIIFKGEKKKGIVFSKFVLSDGKLNELLIYRKTFEVINENK